MRLALLSPLILLAACSTPPGAYPSLQPRAAEAVDPRLPVERPTNDKPLSGELAARLSALVAQARASEPAFDDAADLADRLASGAGARQSESWIAAQQALTAAIAARGPVTQAAGDIDQIAATALQTKGGIAPNDFAAIQRAGKDVASINERQAFRIAAIQRRIGG